MLKPTTKSPAAILFWLSVLYLCVDAFSPNGNFRGAGSGGRGGSWNRRNHIGGDSPGGPHGNPLFMGALIAFGEQKSKPSIAAAPKIKDIKIKSSVLTVQAIKDADAQTNLTAHGVYDEERVANFVSLLNYWYNTQGYILSGIKSHALYANGTLELRAFEARLAPQPLHLEFVRRVPVPQLEELGEDAGSEGAGSEEPASEGQKGPGQKKQQKKAPAAPPPPAPPTNFTLAAVPGNRGKTRPRPVARALGLRSGEVFRWQPERWAAVRQGGLFADADLRVNLVDDATVQLVITAREEKTALLSPGLTKSMGDSTWGADVTFEDRNFLGTTKAVGLEAKKSVHDSFLSAAARVSDARFGLGPGYLLSGFRECAHLRSPLNRHRLFRLPADQYRGKEEGSGRGGGGASGGGAPSRAQRVLGMPTRADARPAGTVVRNGLSAQARWPGPLRAQTLGATLEVLQPPAPDAAAAAPAADTAAAAAEAPEGGGAPAGAAAAAVAAPRVLETGLLVDGVTEAVALVSSETTQVWQREWGQTTWRLSGLAGARVAAYKQAQAAFHKATLSLATVCPLARPLLPARLAGAAAPTLGLSATAMLAPADPRRLPLHYATQLGGPLSLRGFFPGELGVPAQAATATAELRVPVRFSDASEFTVVAFVDGGLFRAVPAAAAAAGGGGGAAEEGEEGYHGSRLRGDRALSHGVGLKAGVFQVDYAVTDTGVARLNLGKGTEVVPEPEAMDAEVVVEASKSTIPETVAEAPEIKIPEPEPEPEPEAAKVAEVVGVSTGSSAIVVVDKETIEVSSGVAGLVAGTIIGGPVVGVLLSVASNYASKKDTDVGEAARGVGKLALDSLNFLGGLAIKYEVAEKVNKAASDTFQKLKEAEGTDKELIEKVEQSFKTTSDKLAELDEEYDLKGLAGEAMKKSGDLATELVEKAIEIDQKEKFSQRLTTWLKKIVDQEMV